jgi:hypothetical protein
MNRGRVLRNLRPGTLKWFGGDSGEDYRRSRARAGRDLAAGAALESVGVGLLLSAWLLFPVLVGIRNALDARCGMRFHADLARRHAGCRGGAERPLLSASAGTVGAVAHSFSSAGPGSDVACLPRRSPPEATRT